MENLQTALRSLLAMTVDIMRRDLHQPWVYINKHSVIVAAREALDNPAPIPMLLVCPSCGEPHVDREQPEKQWFNPPHRTHQCQTCLHEWRPANVPTVGVQELP